MNSVAIVMVIISTILIAFRIIRKESLHCRALETAINMLGAIKNHAMMYNMPFSNIIEEINKIELYQSYKFSDLFLTKLSEEQNIPELWENALCNSGLNLHQYELDVLINYGKDLCVCRRQEIFDIYEKAYNDMIEFKKTAIENKNMKSKSTAAITISAGIIIVMMLV